MLWLRLQKPFEDGHKVLQKHCISIVQRVWGLYLAMGVGTTVFVSFRAFGSHNINWIGWSALLGGMAYGIFAVIRAEAKAKSLPLRPNQRAALSKLVSGSYVGRFFLVGLVGCKLYLSALYVATHLLFKVLGAPTQFYVGQIEVNAIAILAFCSIALVYLIARHAINGLAESALADGQPQPAN